MLQQNNSLVLADETKIEETLEAARMYIERDYISDLGNPANSVIPACSSSSSSIRMIHLNKIVYNSEDIHLRLQSVYHTLFEIADLCFLLICGHTSYTDLYIGLRSDSAASMTQNALVSGIRGNFPGTEFECLDNTEVEEMLYQMKAIENQKNNAVAVLTQIPSRHKKEKEQEGHISVQGLEHFIDALKGELYTAMVVAAPLSLKDAIYRRNNCENLYTSLSAMSKMVYQYGTSESAMQQHSLTESISKNISLSVSDGYSYGTSYNIGTNQDSASNVHKQFNTLGLGYGRQNGSFQSNGIQQNVNQQHTASVQQGRQNAVGIIAGITVGANQNLTVTQENKAVQDLLLRLDEQIHRIRECETYGLWESCVFFAAPAPDIALVAANIYRSLACGVHSGSEKSCINIWSDSKNAGEILNSLSKARMPVFRLPSGACCNAGTMVSGLELPILMNLPQRSVCGVTVVQMASFGRDIYRTSSIQHKGKRGIRIGKVFHMGSIEDVPVKLNVEDLSAHVLVTGTTGVGKSTLMAMLLSALHDLGVKLLVVEPVKGEYKDLLNEMPGLQIFTIDPYKCRMLHINPFEFDANIHVLTHIDRLIEVFSVCWPLYAAQPALLRECIEEAYVRIGWDLSNSVYVHDGPVEFPNFKVLLQIVPEIIEKSHFVGESKGTYEGALLTRIAMLTHGTFGQVFNSTVGIKDEELFNRDTIIDLSDVGSQETISLLMGILIVRLREYRTSHGHVDNRPLNHVMVLEEAHNIFQRNTKQNVEGGESVSGKSVQMLSQCIAEMRGYGQGIFIVDQSPGEIDLSGIRNTATKIVMRQPEASDQHTIAESLSLNKMQTAELSRMPERVALVYQTGWIEPVMVRINDSKEKYKSKNQDTVDYGSMKAVRGFYLKMLLLMEQKHIFDYNALHNLTMQISGFSRSKKADLLSLFDAYQSRYRFYSSKFQGAADRIAFFSHLITELLASEDFFRLCGLPQPDKDAKVPYSEDSHFKQCCEKWCIRAASMLNHYVSGLSDEEKKHTLQLLLLNDMQQRRQISVHNALFGKIKS